MKIERIDALIHHILAKAAQIPRGFDAMHVMAYLYLADCHYGRRHRETFTGIEWRSWYLGVWSPEALARINRIATGLPVRAVVLASPTTGAKQTRWLIDGQVPSASGVPLPRGLGVLVADLIAMIGDDTDRLLRYVRETGPLVGVGPGQPLDFAHAHTPWPERARRVIGVVDADPRRDAARQRPRRRFPNGSRPVRESPIVRLHGRERVEPGSGS